MKTIATITMMFLCLIFLFSTTSCAVVLKKDNGNHKGWHKSPANPNPPTVLNPGKSKGKQNKLGRAGQ